MAGRKRGGFINRRQGNRNMMSRSQLRLRWKENVMNWLRQYWNPNTLSLRRKTNSLSILWAYTRNGTAITYTSAWTTAAPPPNAISPFVEDKFARLEYAGENRFNLSYLRHTGQWYELFREIPLEKCLKEIKEMPHFMP